MTQRSRSRRNARHRSCGHSPETLRARLQRSGALFALGASLWLASSHAEAQCSASAPQYCAGGVDPIGKPTDATLFPIDDVFSFLPITTSGNTVIDGLTMSGTSTGTMTEVSHPTITAITSWDSTFVAASGRIIPPNTSINANYGYPEDVVYAFRNANGNVQVNFVDGAKSAHNYEIPPRSWDGFQLAPLPDPSSYGPARDYIAIAVADLDGAVDANGELNDEVVVAYPALDTSDGNQPWIIQVYVLNYQNATGAPAVTENNTIASACGLNCYSSHVNLTSASDQQKILSSGNIVAVAIGDYDGDGANEIATANVGSASDLRLTLFRYRNFGNPATQSTLLRINDEEYDQLSTVMPPVLQQPPSSYVGNVSLVSGDWDGDGVEELALGYAQWRKNSTTAPGTRNSELEDCVFWNSEELVKGPCTYDGYAITSDNFVTVYHSGLSTTNATITAAGTSTQLTVANADVSVPRRVVVTNATGAWAPLNGVWESANLTSTTFTIPVDSTTFGSLPSAPVTISVSQSLQRGGTDTVNPRIDNPGNYGVPNIIDYRDALSRPTFQLVAGLFNFDSTDPNSFHKRQILGVWNSAAPADSVTLSYANETPASPRPRWQWELAGAFWTVDYDPTSPSSQYNPLRKSAFSIPETAISDNVYGYPHWRFSLTSSNYFGAFTPTDPTYSFAIGALLDQGIYHIRFGKIDGATFNVTHDTRIATGLSTSEPTGFFPTLAYDKDGQSRVLGSPVHFQISDFLSAGYILWEPPKHIAWTKNEEGEYFFNNISRSSSINSQVAVSTTVGQENTNETKTGYDIATSVQLSGEATLSEGNAQLGGSASASASLTLGYERSASNDKLSMRSTTVQYRATDQSNNDDYLQYSEQVIDVWRYRLYGAGISNDPSTPYQMYEIAVPGRTSTSYAAGTSTDWYRPLHENGNILSYPPVSWAQNPVDLSSTPYTIVKSDGSSAPWSNGIMWNQNVYCASGVTDQHDLTISGTTSSTDKIESSNTLKEDSDLKLTSSATAFGFSTSWSVDWKFSATESWSYAETSTSSTSNATTFTLHLGAFEGTYQYAMAPVLYLAQSGAVKMTYGVGIPTPLSDEGCATSSAWTSLYVLADPALPLPRRFDYLEDTPNGTVNQLHSGHDREQLKALQILSPIPDPLDNGNFPELGSNPRAGDTVRLSVQVFNYSTSTIANNVSVSFSTIAVDDNDIEQGCGLSETSNGVCPDSYRRPILDGETGNPLPAIQIASIPTWSNDILTPNYVFAATNWKIPAALATQRYRLYVNLGYAGTETNPPQAPCTSLPCNDLCTLANSNNPCIAPDLNRDPFAPGQNNEGYGYIEVEPAASSLAAVYRPFLSDVFTDDSSLSAIVHGRTLSHVVVALKGHPIRLRLRAKASVREPRHQRMKLMDRELRQRDAKHLAGKLLLGVSPSGSSVYHTFHPSRVGLHRLKLELREQPDDLLRGNNTDELTALVFRVPGDLNGDSSVDLHDLDFLRQNRGRPVLLSRCGYPCDLNQDGFISDRDAELLVDLCNDAECAAPAGSQAVEASTVRALNRLELASLLTLSPREWLALFPALAAAQLAEQDTSAMHAALRWAGVATPEERIPSPLAP